MIRVVHKMWIGCMLLCVHVPSIADAQALHTTRQRQALPMEMPVVATDTGAWALLEPITSAPAPRGGLAISQQERAHVVTAPLNARELTQPRKRWIGRHLHVITREGCLGRARIDALVFLVQAPVAATPQAASGELATALWTAATQHSVAAQLHVVGGTCADPPAMALRHAIPPKHVARSVDHEPFRQAAIEATRQLPGYRKIQQRYEALAPNDSPWDHITVPIVQAFRMPSNRRTLVSVTMADQKCSTEFTGSFWAVFSMAEGRPPKLILASDDAPIMINRVFDRDGDGRSEYFVAFSYGERSAFRTSTGATISAWDHYTVDAAVRTALCRID